MQLRPHQSETSAFLSVVCLLAFLVVSLAGGSPALAVAIGIIFDDNETDHPAFDADGTKLEDIVGAAAGVWNGIIRDDHEITIRIWWDDLDDNLLGAARVNDDDGTRVSQGQIRFDTKLGNGGALRQWFFDPTPFDSSEFNLQQELHGQLDAGDQTDWFRGDPPITP